MFSQFSVCVNEVEIMWFRILQSMKQCTERLTAASIFTCLFLHVCGANLQMS